MKEIFSHTVLMNTQATMKIPTHLGQPP